MRTKWMQEYISGIDISKIEWIKLDANELQQFLLIIILIMKNTNMFVMKIYIMIHRLVFII